MSSNSMPACAETHISWVLLTEDRAFKVAKPVVTDVVDQGDVERRRAGCEREVELNARLAPDVYLGVGSIRLGDEDLEPVIVMRRMPDDRRLSALLDVSDVDTEIRAVARKIASFHATAPAIVGDRADRVASRAAVTRRWADDVAGLRAVIGTDRETDVEHIEHRAMEYLAGRGDLLTRRIDDGLVRDGHGDLLADDIFCLEDGPRILDCLAFSDDLRHGDVLADIAFLIMDLQRRGHTDLARRFLRTYIEFSDEHHPASLAHLYVAQRALVRAKVTALRDHQRGAVPGPDVRAMIDIVIDHLERATVRVALVGGLPGAGKTTIADRLGDEFGWAVLSSDEIRRDLGLRYEDLHSDAAYDDATKARVYDEMRRRAEVLVRQGISVVLDATWTSAAERSSARAMARDSHAELLEVRCVAAIGVCRERVASRTRRTHSEATPEVVDVLDARFDPWPDAVTIRTDDVGPAEVWDAFRSITGGWWLPTPAAAYEYLAVAPPGRGDPRHGARRPTTR